MNRSERRKAKIKNTEKVVNVKFSDLERFQKEQYEKAVDQAFFLMLAIPTMIIHDKFGELMKREVDNKKREERFVNLVLELYDTFQQDYVSLQDLHQCLKEETGLEIKLR